jgi:hypothetical protein
MGDFEQGTIDESASHNPKARLKSVILLVLGIFAPIMITIMTWGMFPEITIQSMFWMYNQSPYMPSFYGFSLRPLYAITSMFPFLLLRMVPVSMLYRYYNEKTTRKRALIASCVGDGAFLIVAIPSIISSLLFAGGYYMIPLPIQMIGAILILWRSPLPEPTAPWEGIVDSKSWWEKSPDAEQQKPIEKPKDNDDELW